MLDGAFMQETWQLTPIEVLDHKNWKEDQFWKAIEPITTWKPLNPLTPKSDQYLNSPYNITPESHIKVMRIKEMVTNLRSSWLLNKFSSSVP